MGEWTYVNFIAMILMGVETISKAMFNQWMMVNGIIQVGKEKKTGVLVLYIDGDCGPYYDDP